MRSLHLVRYLFDKCPLMLAGLLCCLISQSPVSLAQQKSQTSESAIEQSFRPRYVLPRQDTRTLDADQCLPVAEANRWVKPDDLVLGVAIGASSRAYPLNMISGPKRELYNDKLENVSFAVTWCSLCFSAVVYDLGPPGDKLELGIAGSLWNDNMVMYDNKSKSLWSQMTGIAMFGPKKGQSLKRIPSDVMSWKQWRTKYPQTKVALFNRTSDAFWIHSAKQTDDLMFAYVTDDAARGWMFSTLRDAKLINDTWKDSALLIVQVDEIGSARIYDRTVDGKTLEFRISDQTMIDEETESEWDPFTGRCVRGTMQGDQLTRVPAITSFKNKWDAFYPNTDFF